MVRFIHDEKKGTWTVTKCGRSEIFFPPFSIILSPIIYQECPQERNQAASSVGSQTLANSPQRKRVEKAQQRSPLISKKGKNKLVNRKKPLTPNQSSTNLPSRLHNGEKVGASKVSKPLKSPSPRRRADPPKKMVNHAASKPFERKPKPVAKQVMQKPGGHSESSVVNETTKTVFKPNIPASFKAPGGFTIPKKSVDNQEASYQLRIEEYSDAHNKDASNNKRNDTSNKENSDENKTDDAERNKDDSSDEDKNSSQDMEQEDSENEQESNNKTGNKLQEEEEDDDPDVLELCADDDDDFGF